MCPHVLQIALWHEARAARAQRAIVLVQVPARTPDRRDRDEELLLQEINGCKTLLLEVVRRAAYDWVLYRTSRRLLQKTLADQAYNWLFVETPETVEGQTRDREGKALTGFLAICESLDLDPETVRGHIRRLTPKNVMSVGRPAEYRRRDVFSSGGDTEVYSLPGGVLPYDDVDDGREL